MKRRTIDQIEALLKKHRSKLKREINAIDKLERQKASASKPKPQPKPQPKPVLDVKSEVLKILTGVDETLDIRQQPWIKKASNLNDADKAAIAAIEAAQKERKDAKAAAAKTKRKAKLAGELRKMPLEGKAALAKINE
jgi:hypothetical protein